MSRAGTQSATGRSPAGNLSLGAFFLPAVVVAIIAVMAFVEPKFFSRLNISNVLRNFSVIAFFSMAQGLVMIVGGFDLSVGAIAALASVAAATGMVWAGGMLGDAPTLIILVGLLFSLGAATVAGGINGILVARIKASPFIITLGTMTVILGLVFYYTKGAPIYGLPRELAREIGRGRFLDLPVIFWTALVIILALWFMMRTTRLGRHILAVGSNPQAAYESGISTSKVFMIVYGLAGLLAGIAGLVLTARLGAGQPGIGTNAAIESIAAAVIAGVSLRGGIGSIPRIALAALFLAIVANSLNLAQIDSKFQTMVLGFFLIGFVAIERRLERL